MVRRKIFFRDYCLSLNMLIEHMYIILYIKKYFETILSFSVGVFKNGRVEIDHSQ